MKITYSVAQCCLKSQRRMCGCLGISPHLEFIYYLFNVNAKYKYVEIAICYSRMKSLNIRYFYILFNLKKNPISAAIPHEGGGNGREVINLTWNIANEIKMKERINA